MGKKGYRIIMESIEDKNFQKYQNYNYLKRNSNIDLPIHSDLTKADLWTIIAQQEQEIGNL